ncbi:MAG: Prephenate dehydratase (EC @ Arogenate dehydratase (EC [uncultured Caballeronia sp.]|nr:MAG: Prephenate dehydratase (EC @ Arogenate dehydratase (EC [uncultured Caballeronia sp.]
MRSYVRTHGPGFLGGDRRSVPRCCNPGYQLGQREPSPPKIGYERRPPSISSATEIIFRGVSMKVLAPGCVSLRGVFRTGACALLLGFAIGAQAQTVQAGSITAAPTATLPASTPAAAPAPSRLDEILARGTLRVCTITQATISRTRF